MPRCERGPCTKTACVGNVDADGLSLSKRSLLKNELLLVAFQQLLYFLFLLQRVQAKNE